MRTYTIVHVGSSRPAWHDEQRSRGFGVENLPEGAVCHPVEGLVVEVEGDAHGNGAENAAHPHEEVEFGVVVQLLCFGRSAWVPGWVCVYAVTASGPYLYV